MISVLLDSISLEIIKSRYLWSSKKIVQRWTFLFTSLALWPDLAELDMTHVAVLLRNSLADPIPLQVYNFQSFPSTKLVATPRLKRQSALLFTHSLRENSLIYIPFPMVLAECGIQTDPFRICPWVTESTNYDNCNTTCASNFYYS